MSRESRRLSLQTKLEEILGSRNVYFQPPASIHLEYPCIVYSFDDEKALHSNNVQYLTKDKYTITLMTKEAMPDALMSAIMAMPYTSFNRQYSSDNIHHFSYTTASFERY